MNKSTLLTPYLACAFLFLSTSSFCQGRSRADSLRCTQYLDTLSNRQLYRFTEKDATYRGGADAFTSYINRNLKYDKSHVEHQAIVIFTFIVEAGGSVTNVTLKYPPHGVANDIIEKAIITLNRMPKMLPATCGDQKVATRVLQPIAFVPDNR